MKTIARLLIALSFATLLACAENKPQFTNTDITGSGTGGDFQLTDQNGKVRTLADFKGKVVAIFFGFTRCPDVCPINLSEWAQVLKKLGPDGQKLQVLFVTVDPERDTQALLAGYVTAFDPSFIGLTAGDLTATRAVADKYKVFYAKAPNKDGKDYSIDHTAASYLIDPSGTTRLYVRHGQGIDGIVSDVKMLLAEKPKG
jgi:protein SCO1/2